MCEVLRDTRLMDEQSVRAKHPRDLAKRGELSSFPAADVIARSEVDHEIEAVIVEREIADVSHVKRYASLRATDTPLRGANQRRIDVDSRELDWLEALAQHPKRDAAPASDFQHSAAPRQTQCTQHQRNLDAFLEAVSGFHVSERTVFIPRRSRRARFVMARRRNWLV